MNELILKVANHTGQSIEVVRRMDINQFEQFITILEKQAKEQADAANKK